MGLLSAPYIQHSTHFPRGFTRMAEVYTSSSPKEPLTRIIGKGRQQRTKKAQHWRLCSASAACAEWHVLLGCSGHMLNSAIHQTYETAQKLCVVLHSRNHHHHQNLPMAGHGSAKNGGPREAPSWGMPRSGAGGGGNERRAGTAP